MSALDQLRAAQSEPRTKTINLDGVAKALGLDEFHITVRALSADEVNRAKNSRDQSKFMHDLGAAAEALNGKKAGEAMGFLTGIDPGDVQAATALSMAVATAAVTDPADWTHQDTVKLEQNHAIEFQELVHAAYEVTGLGNQVAVSGVSGKPDSAEMP